MPSAVAEWANHEETPESGVQATEALRRGTQIYQPTSKAASGIHLIVTPDIKEPRTYAEAVGDPIYGKQWEAAIQEELGSLTANNT